MKIRIKQPGFENYTGQMGVLQFVDGLSTTDVRQIDAVRMSAVMHCELEDGTSANVAQSLLDNATTPAPSAKEQRDRDQVATDAANAAAAPAAAEPSKSTAPAFTREQLAAVADKEGIKGLRAIAEPLGIKGNSVNALMEAILKSGK